MDSWASRVAAITLFVEDVATAKQFYEKVFGLPVVFEDAESVAFNFGNMIVNLLKTEAASELIAPAAVGGPETLSRFQLTIDIEDVDRVCAELSTRDVEILNGPLDRPWGVRTATFRDPGGHVWEIAQAIA
jgi:catechol 2,3-dioxygenase-like lactoylglutathione lyase family enzyme